MSRMSNLEAIIKAAHDRGNTFIFWRVHRSKSTPVVYATIAPKRKETK